MDDIMAKVTTSATMLLTGFTVVFAVLILLIFIIYIYGNIVYKAQNKSKEKKEAKIQAQQKAEPAPVETAPVVTSAPSNEISGEIIAVISAAVDSMYGQGSKVRIKNIKKSTGRNAWANAGVLDNTRPF